MARPKNSSKYKPEMDSIAEEFLASGYSLEALCGHLLIDRDTLYEWTKKDGEYYKGSFSEAVKRGLDRGRYFWERIGIEMSTMNSRKRPGNFVTWIFNMKNRYGWTDAIKVKEEVTVTNFADYVNQAYAEAAKENHKHRAPPKKSR
ncbi:MAG: hypothetical protein WCV84_04595 [Patescibacteria group bacterium]